MASLVLPVSSLAIVPYGVIQGRLELDRVTKAEMSAGVIALIVVFLLAWNGAGVWSLIGGSLAAAVARASVIYLYSPWWPGLKVGSKRMRRILTFSIGTFGSRTLWAIYDQSDNFILGKVAGEATLGFYRVARDLASIPVTRISTIVNQLSVPLMANLKDNPPAMRSMLLRGVRLTASVSVPICVGIALVSDDLVYIVLGEKWMSIVPVLRILSGMALIKSIDVLIAPVLRARYRTTFLAMYNLVLLIVMPIAFVIGAYFASASGVAYAWLLAYPLVMSRMASEALREIGLPWSVVLSQLRSPILASSFMALTVFAIHAILTGSSWSAVLTRLLLSSGLGAAIYSGVLWILGGPIRNEIVEILSWVFRPKRGKVR
jgi:O-antigen/teichoic acid export membrane protein